MRIVGELDRRANRIANGLRDLWIGRGDRVLWWSDTSLEAIPVFAALAKIGAVFAPLNARGSVDELDPVARYARARLLLCGASHAAPAAELAAVADIPFAPVVPESVDDAVPSVEIDEHDPHVIFFTSGSTGLPKGVVLSHRTNWLRTYVGKTGFLQLGFAYQGTLFLYEVSTEWHERYQRVLETAEAIVNAPPDPVRRSEVRLGPGRRDRPMPAVAAW